MAQSPARSLRRGGHEEPGCRGRTSVNRDEGTTLAFLKAQASKLLEMPDEDTITSLRDRAGRSANSTASCQGPNRRITSV